MNFRETNSVRMKKNFKPDLYNEYDLEDHKYFSDLPSSKFKISDYTANINNTDIGLIRYAIPKTLTIFDSLNWIFCQIWIPEEYRTKGYVISIIRNTVSKLNNVDYILFKINKAKSGIQTFLAKNNGQILPYSSGIYLKLDVDPNLFVLYYLDLRHSSMTEDFNSNKYIIEVQNEDMLIVKDKDTNERKVRYNKGYSTILPFKIKDGKISVLLECKKSKFHEDEFNNMHALTFPTNHADKPTYTTLIQEQLSSIGYDLKNTENIYPQGALFDNNSVFIHGNNQTYLVDLSDEESSDHQNTHSNKEVAWIPVKKVINKINHTMVLALCLKLLKLVFLLSKKNSGQMTMEEMSSAMLASYETPQKPVLKPIYPKHEDE